MPAVTPITTAITQVLRKDGGPMTPMEISKEIGYSTAYIRNTLWAMSRVEHSGIAQLQIGGRVCFKAQAPKEVLEARELIKDMSAMMNRMHAFLGTASGKQLELQ